MTPCAPLQRLGTRLRRMTSPDTARPLSEQGQWRSYTPRLELSNKSCCVFFFFELPILLVLYVHSISDILNLLQMLSPLFYQAQTIQDGILSLLMICPPTHFTAHRRSHSPTKGGKSSKEPILAHWDGSVGKWVCRQDRWPEFDPWKPQGKRRKLTPSSFPLTTGSLTPTHIKL